MYIKNHDFTLHCRTNPVIFRTNPNIFRTNPVIFKNILKLWFCPIVLLSFFSPSFVLLLSSFCLPFVLLLSSFCPPFVLLLSATNKITSYCCRTQEGPAYTWLFNFHTFVRTYVRPYVRLRDQILVPTHSLRDKGRTK